MSFNKVTYFLQSFFLLVTMLIGLYYVWAYSNILMLIFVGIVYISFNLIRIERTLKGGKK